jgi:predicted unusual protein kinase regulating ubiquinone biosynthesis (AarF/ABC1/UbiB family)
MRLLALVVQHAGTLGAMANPVAIVDDFADTLLEELDFRKEAASMSDFRDALTRGAPDNTVFAPSPIDGMVSRRVLVMEFVEGIPIDDEAELRRTHDRPELLLQAVVRAWVRTALSNGVFHGDVHAGNLLVTPDGRVAFLDFGIIGELSGDSRQTITGLFASLMFERDYAGVVRSLADLGVVGGRRLDVDAIGQEIKALAEPLLDAPLSEIHYGEILGQIIRVATRYRIRLPRDLVLVVKQILYFERYGRSLAPDYRILSDPVILGYFIGGEAPSASG